MFSYLKSKTILYKKTEISILFSAVVKDKVVCFLNV